MEERQRTFGWRQLLGAVNLRDFVQMAGGELSMIGSSLRRAGEVAPRLPVGPAIAFVLLLLAILRSALLVIVVIVFGTAIVVISAVRTAMRVFRSPGAQPD